MSRASQPPPTRGSSKALYKPIPTSHSRLRSRPGTQATGPRGALTAAGRDGTLTSFNDNASIIFGKTVEPRDRFQNPDDPQSCSAITHLNHYLSKTELEETFIKLCNMLLKMPNLPYNPYPGLMRRIRMAAEKFHLFEKSDKEIKKILEPVYLESHQLAHLVHPVNCDFVWGMKHMVELTDYTTLKQFEWILRDVTPNKDRLQLARNYSNQVMTALVGPTVFLGTVFPFMYTLHIRHEYLITGINVKIGVEIFVNSVIKDLKYIEAEGTHVLLGVNVPTQNRQDPDTWYLQLWTYAAIEDKRPEFWQTLADAVTGSRYIYAECLFSLDREGSRFQKGQKQYGLNFIQVAEDGGMEEGLSYFTEYPLLTVHDGVFMSQSQAEAYLAMFTSREDLIDKDFGSGITLPNSDPPPTAASQRTTSSQDSTTSSWKAGTRPPKTLSDLRLAKPLPKVRVDGFKHGDRAGHLPSAWQITAPIKGGWQKKIVGFHPQAEIYDSIYYVLLLIIMDRAAYGDELLVEVYRLLHGSGAKVYYLMQLNKTIRELVLKFQGNSQSQLVMHLFIEYKQALVDMLDTDMQERSSDIVTASRAIRHTLQELTVSDEGFDDNVPLQRKLGGLKGEWRENFGMAMDIRRTLETLKNINSYTYTMLLGLVEDAMAQCPNLQSLLDNLKETFPENVPRPHTRERKVQDRSAGIRGGVAGTHYQHGVEEEAIEKHEEQVLNLQMCIERDRAPKSIAVESVLLRYVMDTHLDEVWPTFLVELFSGPKVPPNPFPRLVTTLRQSAMRMDLCYEKYDKLQKKLIHGAERMEDKNNYVYHIPGCDAHGLKAAIVALDSSVFFRLAPLVQKFVQTKFIQRKGPYRVALCCALGGSNVLHGRMDPYLRTLHLNEHCFIRGPDACWVEAAQLYSKIVYTHCVDLYTQNQYIILGLYMGKEEQRWRVEEMMTHKKGYAAEFERFISLKEPIFLRLYVVSDWRLIPVEKHFKFHYIDDEEINIDRYHPFSAYELYQNAFLSKEKAGFYVQYSGPADRSNPFGHSYLKHALEQLDRDILQARDKQDWINVHRLLFWRNLMKQGSSVVVEVWRMLHSVAGQVEYVISLGKSLQDLVQYAMDIADKQNLGADFQDKADQQQNPGVTLEKLEGMMGRMAQAYKQKLQKLCRLQSALAPKCLLSVIDSKLKKITERDYGTKDLFMIIDIKTIFTINEINNMLQCVQDAVAYDVHSISPEVQAMLKSVEAEQNDRPQSVASVQLADPDSFTSRPQAIHSDHVDQWEHF